MASGKFSAFEHAVYVVDVAPRLEGHERITKEVMSEGVSVPFWRFDFQTHASPSALSPAKYLIAADQPASNDSFAEILSNGANSEDISQPENARAKCSLRARSHAVNS